MIDSCSATGKIVPIDPHQAELCERVQRASRNDGLNASLLQGLSFLKASEISQPLPSLYTPALCVVVQGRKRAIVAGQSYHYDAFNYLLVSVTLPVFGQILDASPERPYLCMRIDIDVPTVSHLLLEMEAGETTETRDATPLYVARMSSPVLDALLRLMQLLDTPRDLPVLGALTLREIWYRLLRDEMGPRLRELVALEGPVQRISRAIDLLRRRFDQPLRIEELADVSHMSASTFHARFKAVTSMSPLQFQKQIRLHEARRLMVSDGLDGASAAHTVGYASPSQFNREYRRLFGAPPRRDLALLRARSEGETATR